MLQASPEPTARVAARVFSRPPLVPPAIDGRPVEILGDDSRMEITLGGEPLMPMEPWQYHVLNGLNGFGGDTLQGLHDLVQDRFGIDLPHAEIANFFRKLKAHELVDPAEQARRPVVDRAILGKPDTDTMAQARSQQVGTLKPDDPGGLVILRPAPLLRLVRPFFGLVRIALVFLPPIALMAAFEGVRYWDEITEAFRMHSATAPLLSLLLLGLVSVNLVVTIVYACAAFAMGANVDAVVLRLVFRFLPRLALRIDDTEKLSRRQAMWMHAAPLITRFYIAAAALLLFVGIRHFGGQLPETVLTISAIAAASFLVTACPFYRGHGYHLLVEFLDEPKLRAKAFKALLNAFNRNFYQNADQRILMAYALVSIAFTLLLAVLVFIVFGGRILQSLGPDGIVVVALLVLAFLWRTWRQLQTTNQIYWQNYRFERWRDRTLPSQAQRKIEDRTRITPWRAIRLLLLAGLVIGLFQTYTYRPSGPVVMLPLSINEISSDLEEIVEEVYFEGGEFVTAGTPVAKLSTQDLEAERRVLEAEMIEAEADLTFAQLQCERNMSLFDGGNISDAQMQRVLAECAGAEARVEVLKAQIERIDNRIERSTLRMPFDGHLGTLYLKERLGTFLDEGEPIATVRDTSAFRVRMKVREVDLGLVQEGAPLEVRVYAYPDDVFEGVITSIDPDVESTGQGSLVDMVGTIENRDGKLHSGMTGMAKTPGVEMPVWRVITQGIYRFFVIDLWAWLP